MTNNKIKMAQKSVDINKSGPFQEFLQGAQNNDIVQLIKAIIDMDNEEFNDMSEQMYASMEKTFNSIGYRNAVAQHLSIMTDIDYEQEKAAYNGMQEMIDSFELTEEKAKFVKYIFEHLYESVLRYETDPSEHITVTFKKLNENAIVPTYAHVGDAGADLYAAEDCTAKVGEVTFVHTGIAMKIPKGYEGQIRPRSGMSAKTKIRVANAPGTIDSNYRGEICILVDNNGSAPYIISKGDRIAQIVFNKVPTADFIEGEVDTEEDNSRGDKGFGSSGTTEVNE